MVQARGLTSPCSSPIRSKEGALWSATSRSSCDSRPLVHSLSTLSSPTTLIPPYLCFFWPLLATIVFHKTYVSAIPTSPLSAHPAPPLHSLTPAPTWPISHDHTSPIDLPHSHSPPPPALNICRLFCTKNFPTPSYCSGLHPPLSASPPTYSSTYQAQFQDHRKHLVLPPITILLGPVFWSVSLRNQP